MLEATESVFIGLGSNLEQPIQQIEKAFLALSVLPKTQLVKKSSLYLSEPMQLNNNIQTEINTQEHYVNAVAKLTTALSPMELLNQLQLIENSQGRIRQSERWSARTLDLDLLLYGKQIINNQRLTVPHYGMKQRAFVITPLAEIEPLLYLPDSTAIKKLAHQLGSQGVQKL